MYYSIKADPFHDRGIMDDPPLPEGVSFIRGAWIDWQPDAPLIFRSNCDTGNPPREYMGGALPVWSNAMLDAFRSAGVDNVQAFRAVVTDDDGINQWEGYFAINVLGLVAAADLTASKFTKLGERPGGTPFVGFQKLVIDPAKIHDLLLFRLAESPLELIVHERIIDHLSAMTPANGWGIFVTELQESH